MSLLTPEQRAEFDQQGFLLVSGLIPTEILHAAQTTMDRILAERNTYSFGTDAFGACYTEPLCQAAAELGGEPERGAYFPISSALAIIAPPSEGEWTWPGPHIDHAIPQHGHHVFPRPFRIASLLYLREVEPHGGGTVVWPGSHRKIERLAQSDPTHYELMATLNQELGKADLGAPQEVISKAGDILFYHYLLAHAGSKNTTSRPRLALNHKW